MKKLFICLVSLVWFFSCSDKETNSPDDIPSGNSFYHPCLLFTAAEQETLEVRYGNDPLFGQLKGALLDEAARLLSVSPLSYTLKDMSYVEQMLDVSREQTYRILTLGLAYRLTGSDLYAKKIESELLNVCNFPDWNPQHYLDVAEMTVAVAIGYDWAYDALSDITRRKIVTTIRKYALDLALKEYETGDAGSWAKRETNWNVVCHAGMVLGALAIADVNPEYVEPVIRNAVRFMPNCLQYFAPDGVCYEGPSYWGYTHMFLSLFIKAVNDHKGQNYGISSLEGVDKAARCYVESISPSGKVFNFADAGSTEPESHPIYFFFSHFYDQPDVAVFYRSLLSERLNRKSYSQFFFLAIPWFDDSVPAAGKEQLPLTIYRGINDIAVLRGKREVPHSLYLIAKGGDPDAAHQQLDVGTFVVESNGIRWSDDLGTENYDLPGFWDYRPEGQRWNYFRNTNFSHNTLSIDNRLQYAGGRGDIVNYNADVAEPYVTFDMTTVYKDQAESVLRTFRMENDETIIVMDEVELMNASQTLTWHMITAADIRIEGSEILLTKDGESCRLTVLSPADAIFSTQTASAWSPQEKPVTGYKQLFIRSTGRKQQKIEIRISSSGK